jgi:hypothetical protein
MSKRRIRFELGEIKIAGLKLEIDDELDAATTAFRAVQQLIAGAIQPAFAQALVSGDTKVINGNTGAPEGEAAKLPPAKKASPRRSRLASSGDPAKIPVFTHDPEKYGNPATTWKVAQKAIWTLWAIQESGGAKEMTTTQIADTFNKYFREFRVISSSNVSRDLGSERKKNPPTVGSNPDSSTWYLLEAGKTAAKALAHPAPTS